MEYPKELKEFISKLFKLHFAIKDEISLLLKELLVELKNRDLINRIDYGRILETLDTTSTSTSYNHPVVDEFINKMKLVIQKHERLEEKKKRIQEHLDRMKEISNSSSSSYADAVKNPLPSNITPNKKRKRDGKVFDRISSGSNYDYINTPSISNHTSSDGPIVGTSTTLEKRYLRLTSAPDPSLVRPLFILQKSFQHVLNQFYNDDKKDDYVWFCDQMKSIRQDLTVQQLKGEFVCKVYETHAKIALENQDMGEFNQCQTQLVNLTGSRLEEDFLAYRLLYFIFTLNRLGVNQVIGQIRRKKTGCRKDGGGGGGIVKYALAVRKCVYNGLYHELFQLYLRPYDKWCKCLMEQFVRRERVRALLCICRAYRPGVEVSFLSKELGFAEEEECREFLRELLVVGEEDNTQPARNVELIKQISCGGGDSVDCKQLYLAVQEGIGSSNALNRVDIKGQL